MLSLSIIVSNSVLYPDIGAGFGASSERSRIQLTSKTATMHSSEDGKPAPGSHHLNPSIFSRQIRLAIACSFLTRPARYSSSFLVMRYLSLYLAST